MLSAQSGFELASEVAHLWPRPKWRHRRNFPERSNFVSPPAGPGVYQREFNPRKGVRAVHQKEGMKKGALGAPFCSQEIFY
jgi:hypothetical protein